MTGEELSNGSEGVLAYGCEDGRAGKVPELPRFDDELLIEITGSGDGADITIIGVEGC